MNIEMNPFYLRYLPVFHFLFIYHIEVFIQHYKNESFKLIFV